MSGADEVPLDLAELAAWITEETSGLQAVRFDGEGGFEVGGD
jgi:hypothetical protein